MPSSALLESAVLAVADACAVARAIQRQAGGAALAKSDDSPVTIADFAVQAIVASRLERAAGRGRLRLVGEESAAALRDPARAATRDAVIEAVRSVDAELTQEAVLAAIDLGVDPGGGGDGFWTIDPIDGTKGFIRGEQYAVCLARIEGGEPTAAVLGCPNLALRGLPAVEPPASGSLLVAERGGGCWQRSELAPREPGERLRRRPVDPAGEIVLCESVVASPASRARRDGLLAAAGLRHRGVQLDSQCKYALVARGDADVYIRLPKRTLPIESIWDHASGALCVAEAGGAVRDLDGRPLDFGRGRTLAGNRGIIGCGAELMDALLRAAETVDLDPFASAAPPVH